MEDDKISVDRILKLMDALERKLNHDESGFDDGINAAIEEVKAFVERETGLILFKW